MFSPNRSSASISSSTSSRSCTSSISSSKSSATSAMSSSLTGGDEGAIGVESGTFAVGSRVRLRAGEDCCISIQMSGVHTILDVGRRIVNEDEKDVLRE